MKLGNICPQQICSTHICQIKQLHNNILSLPLPHLGWYFSGCIHVYLQVQIAIRQRYSRFGLDHLKFIIFQKEQEHEYKFLVFFFQLTSTNISISSFYIRKDIISTEKFDFNLYFENNCNCNFTKKYFKTKKLLLHIFTS